MELLQQVRVTAVGAVMGKSEACCGSAPAEHCASAVKDEVA